MVRPALARRRAKLALLPLKTPLTEVGPQPRSLAPGPTHPMPPVDSATFRPPNFARLRTSLVVAGLTAYIPIYPWADADYTDFQSLMLWLCTAIAGAGGALLMIAGRDRLPHPHTPVAPGAIPGGISADVRLARKPMPTSLQEEARRVSDSEGVARNQVHQCGCGREALCIANGRVFS